MYLSGLPPPRPPRLHFVIFAKAIIPSLSTRPAAYLFLIGVHRGGIGQCSSFQDTIPLFGRRVRLSGRVEAAAASTRDWQLVSCRLLSSGSQVVASIDYPRDYPYLGEDFLKPRRIFPHAKESQAIPNAPQTSQKPKKKTKKHKPKS